MKKFAFAVVFFATVQVCFSQPANYESEMRKYKLDSIGIARLMERLRNSNEDTSRVRIMVGLIQQYSNQLDSGIHYCFKTISLSRKINYHKGELWGLVGLENQLKHHGLLLKAFNAGHNGLQASKRYGEKWFEANFLGEIGILYRESGVFPEALRYLNKSKNLFDSIGAKSYAAFELNNIGEVYLAKNELDSALSSCSAALRTVRKARIQEYWMVFYTSLNLGNIFMEQGNYDSAMHYLKNAKRIGVFLDHQINTNLSLAKLFDKIGMRDSSLLYATEANRVARQSEIYSLNADVNAFLGKFYHNEDINKSINFTRLSLAYKDSLYRQSVVIGIENFSELDEQEKQFEIQSAKAAYQFKARIIGLLAGVAVLLVIIGILIRNYRHKQRSIVLLNKQKDEIKEEKEKTETALTNLKATQSQLIQSEKMASLGELTAGIAHEIQNPLNFVNNFSEVNTELIGELQSELNAGDRNAADKIITSIKDNEEKISFHGKRADAIVKNMLLHSRGRSGEKELVDINAICDEYVRLAYHGFRAKDKSFTATTDVNLDRTIPRIRVVPQDIGRVVLNIINNAYYAVRERMGGNGYEPKVNIRTKRIGDKIEIRILDNGSGMPDKIKEKIFQPFFTTKPTGQGTGLGLSLAYDIITKAHSGELEVTTKQGEGTEFIIRLPV